MEEAMYLYLHDQKRIYILLEMSKAYINIYIWYKRKETKKIDIIQEKWNSIPVFEIKT